MTRLHLDTTKWLPTRSVAANNRGISGIYQADDPTLGTTYITNEFQAFQRVPDQMVKPLLPYWGLEIGNYNDMIQIDARIITYSTFFAITLWGFQPSNIALFSTTLLTTKSGWLLTHEWGHAVDNGYQVHGGPQNGRSSQADFTALWNRANGLKTTHGQLYYGWTNIFEFFAELFRMHWMGSGGGTPAHDPNADGDLRNLVSGPGSDVLPDDSYATTAHAIMASLAPSGGVL